MDLIFYNLKKSWNLISIVWRKKFNPYSLGKVRINPYFMTIYEGFIKS